MKRITLFVLLLVIAVAVFAEDSSCMESEMLARRNVQLSYQSGEGMYSFLASFLLSPIVGLIAVAGTAIGKPDAPLSILEDVNESCYLAGYQTEAHKMDMNASWLGLGIGTLCLAVLVAAVGGL